MTGTKVTSTGHAAADTPWLDHHYQSARPEYEDSLRHVGIMPGWTMLDAGCGGGNFLPLMCELVGPHGTVVEQFTGRPTHHDSSHFQDIGPIGSL